MARKYVYFFGGERTEGGAHLRELLGGKGANLAEMCRLGIPVPPGFTITTEVCTYYQGRAEYPPELPFQVREALSRVEEMMGTRFGDPQNPLLLSVRSGARVSMPGMMDTVLNLGLNDRTVQGLAARTGDERFAYDCYRRFVQMFGDVVLGLKPRSEAERDPFEVILEDKKRARGVEHDVELSVEDLKELVREFQEMVRQRLGVDFPQDVQDQLWRAIGAVFGSWNNPRAVAYREFNGIPHDWGTAVNVQAMVFGNLGEGSATGVAFTRNPATGEPVLYGEYLPNAQGEDVVAGIRTPRPLNRVQKERTGSKFPSLEEVMPEVYQQLEGIARTLERHYRDLQDIEFTVQEGRLWMLQTRAGKRTAFAALRIAVDMVREGLIEPREALMRVEPEQLNQLLRPTFDPVEKDKALKEGRLLARGLNAGPGAASGRVAFTASEAERRARQGEEVVLVRVETSPEDIRGMNAAQGILTARGGMTSHAALVARQMGKICVVGCGALEIDYSQAQMRVGNRTIREGDWISLDGNTGEVFLGRIPTVPSEVTRVVLDRTLRPEDSPVYRDYAELMRWADEYRKVGVRANADQPDQAALAVAMGAEGIGLCRTEHMFFEGDRIDAMREMILAEDRQGRERALAKLEPMQTEDFVGLFRVMEGRPVVIRTLDPPLHEFLPLQEEALEELARRTGRPVEELRAKVESLREANPMLGHRGCRLGIVYPEITAMQARAIFRAACRVKREGIPVLPEVMIPLVGDVRELRHQREVVDQVAREVMEAEGVEIDYKVGTMIEVPRAALTADQIATVAEFFSFGTNDLTQTTYGLSRDDAGRFLPAYFELKIWEEDPFAKLDRAGVGELVRIGVERGRRVRADLEVGICGEHGGEPSSVEFCHQVGLNYVSCSPWRLPIARLAAAQAAIKEER